MSTGFFLVYRKLFDHEIGQNPLIVALWVKLISMASYEEKEMFWDGSTIQTKRGQIITSVEKLAKWLRVSRSTTKRHLIALQTIRQIDIKTTNKYTVITIQNYDKYQVREQQTIQQTNIKSYNRSPQLKNIKNIKKLTNIEREEKIPLSYLTNIPENDLKEFITKFKATKSQVIEKGESLLDYVKSHNKKYVDHKSLLNNTLRKDFGKRPDLKVTMPQPPEEVSQEERDRIRAKILDFKKDFGKIPEPKVMSTFDEEARRKELLTQAGQI